MRDSRARGETMSSTTTRSHIRSVGTVFATVTDQDAAIAFYTEKLGFELSSDVKYGDDDGFRWVEVVPPGAETVVALVPPMEDGSTKPGGNLQFGYETDDLDAA